MGNHPEAPGIFRMMPRIRLRLRCLGGSLLLVTSASAQSPPAFPFDSTLARQYLREAAALTARDSGRLWGRSLAGSLLFVDPGTRSLLSDTPDAEAGPLLNVKPVRPRCPNSRATWRFVAIASFSTSQPVPR